MMIVSEEAQEEVKGVIRQGGQPTESQSGNGIIHYSGQRQETDPAQGIIHHNGQPDTNPNSEELPEGSTIVNGQILPPMKNSVKRGMIIAEGNDSIVPVRPLTRATHKQNEE